jgi:hypothetical protein
MMGAHDANGTKGAGMSGMNDSYGEGAISSEWAAGGALFAACMLIMVGVFQVLAGIVALVDDDFYVAAAHYPYDMSVTAWGWIHLIVGALVLLTGLSLLAGRSWAVIVAIILAILNAIENFFFIPYYPVWSVVIIAIDIFVIWALTRPGVIVRRR